MWTISIEDDQNHQTSVQLVAHSYLIGRGEDAEIRLTERNVSRRHAALTIQDGQLFFSDHESYNGSYINGVRVAQEEPLHHADVLHLGDYRLTICDQRVETSEQGFAIAQGTSTFATSVAQTHSNQDRLVILVGPSPGSEFVLQGDRFVVGRGEECDFQIPHASVSRVHAEIRKIETGKFEVLDKASANGLRINGVELPQSILDNRDVVELGDVALKFIPQGQVFHADRSTGERIVALSGAPPPLEKEPSKLSLGSALFAAALGAAGVVVALLVVNLFDAPAEPVATHKKVNHADKAAQLLKSGELLPAHTALSQIQPLDPLKKSEAYLQLKTKWASAVLKAAAIPGQLNQTEKLLDLLANDEDSPMDLRQQAAARLIAIRRSE